MSNECLVTKLKGAVNNPALPKMGYLGFEVSPVEGVDNFQPFVISGDGDGKPLAYINGEGNFYADEQRTQLIGKELPALGTRIPMYLSHDVQHVFLNMYGITLFEPYTEKAQFLNQMDLKDFKYFKKLNDLNVMLTAAYNFFGATTNLDDLDADVAAGLECLIISGDNIAGNIERFSGLTRYSSLEGHLDMSGVTGEISTLSRLPQIFLSHGSNVTYHGQKGENSIPTLLIMDVELGDDVDNYLIDTARLTQGINIGDYDYLFHHIEINGNRTSASDAAVATLKQWGVNYIRVNGVNI